MPIGASMVYRALFEGGVDCIDGCSGGAAATRIDVRSTFSAFGGIRLRRVDLQLEDSGDAVLAPVAVVDVVDARVRWVSSRGCRFMLAVKG